MKCVGGGRNVIEEKTAIRGRNCLPRIPCERIEEIRFGQWYGIARSVRDHSF